MSRSRDLELYIGIVIFIGMWVLYHGLTDEPECAPYTQIGIVPLKCQGAK